MKKNIIFLCAFIVVGLSTQPVFSQYYWPNCGSINCTTSTQWQYITDFTITDFMVTETIGGVPPYTYSIPCTTTVHVDFRWRICDGKYEFELWKFWWDFSQCPLDYNDPNFSAKMQSLHSRLYPALISDFYRERLNKFGFNDIICPPYCCPNSFASVSMTAASCFLLSIEWDEGTPTNGGVQHHTIPISASNGIEFYVGQVPTGVTPYISVSNCDVTTCCTRTYKICEDVNVPGNPEDRIIEDEVQPPPPSPNTCVVSNNFTCFPRCNQ